MVKDVKREMQAVRREHAKRAQEREVAAKAPPVQEQNPDLRHEKNLDEKTKRVNKTHALNVRNKLIHDTKQPDISPQETLEPQKGKDLKYVAEGLADGKRRKLANEPITPAWNKGFKKEVVPQGYRIKQQVDKNGRINVQFEKSPELKDPRKLREEQANTAHMDRAIRGFDPEQARMKINQKIESRLDNVKEYLKWVDKGGQDQGGLKETVNEMKNDLERFGHTELAELVPVNGNREELDNFIKTMNKRLGIKERKELPDLVSDKILRSDGVEQEVWHMPTVSKKKKLNIRPGYIKEPMERLHGHEGRENDIVRQMKWSKDPDFLKTKGGIINQGDWKFDSNQEITKVHRTKGSQGFEYGGVNPSAIVVYKDGSRAFIKKEDPLKLRREYGVSKAYNTYFKKQFPDVFDFNIPRSNIVDLKYLQNDDVYDTIGANSGEVIRNEYVEGYPMDVMLDTDLLSKVKPSSLIKSFVFNMALGNNDYHAGNVLLDSDGNITVIDTANALDSIIGREDITTKFLRNPIFQEYISQLDEVEADDELVDGLLQDNLEHIKAVIEAFKNMDDDTIYNILQNTEMDDSQFEDKKQVLMENLDAIDKYFFGSDEDKQQLETLWQERFEEAQKEAKAKEGVRKPDSKAQSQTESLGGDTSPIGEATPDQDRERLKQELLEELKNEYDFVPKAKQADPFESKDEITEDEYNSYIEESKPKAKYTKYTDDDIAKFQEIQEEQAGVENNWLMQTLAAKAFGLPEDNVDENIYESEINEEDAEYLHKIWSASQDQLKEEYPDGFIELYRIVDRSNLPEAESGDVISLPVRNVSYWAEKDDMEGEIGEVLSETLEDPILVKANVPIEKVLYTPSIINTGEWREYGIIGTNIDSSLVDEEEDSEEENEWQE